MPNIAPERQTIGDLLKMGLAVPDWQRNYSWTEEEWHEFWNDLIDFNEKRRRGRSSPYFVGTIILVDDVTPAQILDGQQRLATASILLAAIRDELSAGDNESEIIASDVQSDFISLSRSYDEDKPRNGLTLNLYDKDFYRSTIGVCPANLSVTATQESHDLIRGAYKYFTRELKKYVPAVARKDLQEKLKSLISSLTSHFLTMTIRVDDSGDAMHVFEVVNDRGIGLSGEDLVRSFLLQQTSDTVERESIIQVWQEVFELYRDPKYRNYLRHYWVSKYGDARSKALAETIRESLKEHKESSVAFSDGLKNSIQQYRDLIDANLGKRPRGLELIVADSLQDISDLGAIPLYPAALSAFETWSDSESRSAILEALITAFVRHTVVGRRESTLLETEVFSLARDIRTGITVAKAIERLRKFSPDDETFKNDFKSFSVSRAATAQHLLRRIEEHLNPSEDVVLRRRAEVWLEHIIPQSTPRNSPLKPLVRRFGNLTLLAHRSNRVASNSPYGTKRPIYAKSSILITKSIAKDYIEWSEAQVKRRQLKLANCASALWTFAKPRKRDIASRKKKANYIKRSSGKRA